jgi:hypothetical protein
MRDDLLHARASIDWAVAHFQDFQSRLDAWCKANVEVSVKQLPPDVPNNVIVATEKASLPLDFNVEFGAYINAIRSSLDILASTLAARHCPALIKHAYFPVASSDQAFAAGNYKGSKLIRALPDKERDIIKSIKPYKGGNPTLFPLHHLDILRKHVRLLSVLAAPARLGMRVDAFPFFHPVATGWMRSSHEETVLGLISKDAPDPQFDFDAQVVLNETSYSGRTVIDALQNFATFATLIIWQFDGPAP